MHIHDSPYNSDGQVISNGRRIEISVSDGLFMSGIPAEAIVFNFEEFRKKIDEENQRERDQYGGKTEEEPSCSIISPISFRDILNEPVYPSWIVNGFILRDDPLMLHAEGGTGKSMFGQYLGLRLAANQVTGNLPDILFNQFIIPQPVSTLLVQSENSRMALFERTRLMVAGEPELERGLDRCFCPGLCDDPVLTFGHFTDQVFLTRIDNAIKTIEDNTCFKIQLMVIDPLISFHGEDENSADMRKPLDKIREFTSRHEITPLIIHHDNRLGSYRGSGSIPQFFRSVISLKPKNDGTRKIIQVHHEKCNNSQQFADFFLEMTGNLTFNRYSFAPEDKPGKNERADAVRNALRDMGGESDSIMAIAQQYSAATGISVSSARRHVEEAIKGGYIYRRPNPATGDKRTPYIFVMDNPNKKQTQDYSDYKND